MKSSDLENSIAENSAVKRWLQWGITLLVYAILGMGTGIVLDRIAWSVSYDYVYAPGEFTKAITPFAFLIGALVACFTTWCRGKGIRFPQWLQFLVVAFLGIVVCSVAIATVGGLFAQVGLIAVSHKTIIPQTRIYFCEGLRYGAYAGIMISSLYYWTLFISKNNETHLSPSSRSINQSSSQSVNHEVIQ